MSWNVQIVQAPDGFAICCPSFAVVSYLPSAAAFVPLTQRLHYQFLPLFAKCLKRSLSNGPSFYEALPVQMWSQSTAVGVLSAPVCHNRTPSSRLLLDVAARLCRERHGHHRVAPRFAQASELQSAKVATHEREDSVEVNTLNDAIIRWNHENAACICGQSAAVLNDVLQHSLFSTVHTLSFQQTFEVYQQLSKVCFCFGAVNVSQSLQHPGEPQHCSNHSYGR
jgi:hypothetical protein